MPLDGVARHVPAFTGVIDVAHAQHLAAGKRLLPGAFDLAGPDLGRDIDVAALQRGQHGQGFADFNRRLAAVAVFQHEALDAGQDKIGLPVQSAETDGPVDFANGGGGRGLGRGGGQQGGG